MKIAPGEPVPPGFENEVKATAEIQSKIDKCRNVPFTGLEYLLELSSHDKQEPAYLCVLCEKRGDPRTIMDHITSYKHRLKYLVKFPQFSICRHSKSIGEKCCFFIWEKKMMRFLSYVYSLC